METKSVVEFLWGSPIVTDDSDEDWLVFFNGGSNEPTKLFLPQLAGQRDKRLDCKGINIKTLPDFLFEKPFCNCMCLFSKEYFVDEVAVSQIKEIISMREDIARMNLPSFYDALTHWIDRMYPKLEHIYWPKLASKLANDYALASRLALGASFEEARSYGIEVSAPIKLKLISQEQSLEILNFYKNRFNQKEIRDFFMKEPNTETYMKVKSIVDSIDLESLSGVSIKGALYY